MKRWKVGDAARLDAEYKPHLGRLPADTPGEIVKLEFGRRVLLRTAAGEIWIDEETNNAVLLSAGDAAENGG